MKKNRTDPLLKGFGDVPHHGILVVGDDDLMGIGFQRFLCIGHGDGPAGRLEHAQIVDMIAEDYHIFHPKSVQVGQYAQGSGFAGGRIVNCQPPMARRIGVLKMKIFQSAGNSVLFVGPAGRSARQAHDDKGNTQGQRRSQIRPVTETMRLRVVRIGEPSHFIIDQIFIIQRRLGRHSRR